MSGTAVPTANDATHSLVLHTEQEAEEEEEEEEDEILILQFQVWLKML